MADRPDATGYWMHEASGVLRPAVEAYLHGGAMTPEQIAAMRAYLRQWVAGPLWIDFDGKVSELRERVDTMTDRQSFDRWIGDATNIGMDPL
jgi:hypothetical protein